MKRNKCDATVDRTTTPADCQMNQRTLAPCTTKNAMNRMRNGKWRPLRGGPARPKTAPLQMHRRNGATRAGPARPKTAPDVHRAPPIKLTSLKTKRKQKRYSDHQDFFRKLSYCKIKICSGNNSIYTACLTCTIYSLRESN
jgi:hypothetical protein